MIDLQSIALLGSANLDYLAMNFRETVAELGVRLDVYVPPFGQAQQELLSPGSGLFAAKPQTVLIVERGDDILSGICCDPLGLSDEDRPRMLGDRLERLVALIELARQKLEGTIFVLSPAFLQRSPLGLADATHPRGLRLLQKEMEKQIQEAVSQLPGVHLIDMEQLISEVGRNASDPGKYWHIGRVPFSNRLNQHIARRVIGAMMAKRGKTIRLLVLDLDNTLWGGVLGEDGLENLRIGGTHPGSAYKEFQRAIKGLSRRGIALAISSKNDESHALSAIKTHPEMVLRLDDFAAHRINWNSKAQNIAEMLEELSLGNESCCFIDDNPVERESVRRALPGILVPDVPEDPTVLASWLLNLPQLETLDITSSDTRRSEQYRVRAVTNAHKQAFTDINDYYRDLQMEVKLEGYGGANEQRIQQLLVKTNQFNATTRRHNAEALRKMKERGCEIFGVGLKDRFSEYELIGVIILEPVSAEVLSVESLLLSCRVLGRTLEAAIMGWMVQRAVSEGFRKLVGEIVPTERNTPVRDVYLKHGFQLSGENRYEFSLANSMAIPSYFSISG